MVYNPYATDEAQIDQAIPEYSMPRGTYAAPDITEGDAYIKPFGWGPKLETSAQQTPSAQRLGVIPRYDSYPDPDKSPEQNYAEETFDAVQRHRSAESVTGVPWRELKGVGASDHRWAPNPRSTPPPESRMTQALSPGTYAFTRPFDQLNRTYDGDPPTGSKRQFTGWHFSMADHRREYEAVGSMPVQSHRNTYRLEPAPWDENIVDMPSPVPIVTAVVQNAVTARPRSWRL